MMFYWAKPRRFEYLRSLWFWLRHRRELKRLGMPVVPPWEMW